MQNQYLKLIVISNLDDIQFFEKIKSTIDFDEQIDDAQNKVW